MDFQSAMETFAEAWVAANTKGGPLGDLSVQNQALALTRNCKSPTIAGPVAMCQSRCESRGQLERVHTPAPPISATPNADNDSIISPPSIKDEFDKTSQGKSLPVHCVVETVCHLEESRLVHSGQWKRRPIIETDSFVIIPIKTPFRDLMQAALHRLGYSSDSVSAARGSLIMKNWKPLTFDQITDDPVITVGDILSELTTVATLRIQMYRARNISPFSDIKDKLLKLLLMQSHGRLLSTGCPLDELVLSQMCHSDGLSAGGQQAPDLSEDCRRKFEQWWASQLNAAQHMHSALYEIAQAGKVLERPASLGALPDHVHPAMQTVQNQYPTQKTRMRTSFDPELELPKLQRWFADNQHPNRQQIQQYVKELNGLESRRGRKPLDVNNVVYWFKNARAAQKRAEVRNMSPGGSISCHLAVNGYNSSSHSPPNGSSLLLAGDGYGQLKSPQSSGYERNRLVNIMPEEISMPDSDLDDDEPIEINQRTNDERPVSPSVPLSLTTNRCRDEPSHASPLRGTSPLDRQVPMKPKAEPFDEPVDLHSASDLSNNNNKIKSHVSDNEDEKPIENGSEGMNKCLVVGDSTDVDVTRLSDMNRQQLRTVCSPASSEQEYTQLVSRGVPGADSLERLTAGFPLVPNSMFSQSIMYMSQYIPGLAHGHGSMSAAPPPGSSGLSMSALAASAADERRKRNRTFIDPVTEVPRLEHWFSLNTHPSHSLILKYTEELNRMTYRQKFPKLEPKNVQFWFKNRRAKCKRLKMSLFDSQAPPSQYHHDRE